MSSPTSPRLAFRDVLGLSIEQPSEWQPAILEVLAGLERWEGVQLLVNGKESPVVATHRWGEARILFDWPRSGPGSYQISCAVDGVVEERVIRIGSSKLGDGGLDSLLSDLEQRLPASIALNIQKAGGLAGVIVQDHHGENTFTQEMLRLNRALHGAEDVLGLCQVLPLIGLNPHRVLRLEDRWIQRDQARRVHGSRLLEAFTRSGNVDGSKNPALVVEQRVQHTYDVLENRLLKAYLTEVRFRIRRLAHSLRNGQAEDLVSLSKLQADLERAERAAPFLGEVTLPKSLPESLTMVLLKEPRYRAMLDGYMRFHRSLWASIDEEQLSAPLENLPYLYEAWGTLVVIDLVLKFGLAEGFAVVDETIMRRSSGALFVEVLKSGYPALILERQDGMRIVVTPQRTFANRGRLQSVSFPQRPDITIEIGSRDVGATLVILDPKYKLQSEETEEGNGTPVKSDVDKMHAYRDAIVADSGGRVVDYAATIYPGATTEFGPCVAALHALPGQLESLSAELGRALARAMYKVAAG